MHHFAKLHQSQPSSFRDIAIFRFSRWRPMAIRHFRSVGYIWYHPRSVG